MRWPQRTRFGDDIAVVLDRETATTGAKQRVPSLFLRFELRAWLMNHMSPERSTLLDMYRTAYRGVRTRWTNEIHAQWTDKFWIRRDGCNSDPLLRLVTLEAGEPSDAVSDGEFRAARAAWRNCTFA